MNEELNTIAQQLLDYWLNNNIVKNFTLFELFIKVSKLSYMDSDKNEELLKLITYIKYQYTIPVLSINVDAWLEENECNSFIYGIYQKLSSLKMI